MRWIRLLIVVILIAVLLGRQAARFLVVDNRQKSDAIVVLAGETSVRPALGVELLRTQMGSRLFLDAEAAEQIFDQPLTEIAQRYINSLPESKQISVCSIVGLSTAAETSDVARCIGSTGAHRVLIVTSDYHSRRALMIFSRRLPQYQWSIAAAHNPAAFGDAWWTHRQWAKTTFDEWTKLVWWEAVDRWK
jgi:uncharacterized SAM-binding protein YcdF (DUF218 family)